MIIYRNGDRYSLGFVVRIEPEILELTPYKIVEGPFAPAFGTLLEDGEAVAPALAGKRILLGEKSAFALQEFHEQRNWDDCTLWSLCADADRLAAYGFFNRAAGTLAPRMNNAQYQFFTGFRQTLLMYVTDRRMAFTDMSFEFNLAGGHPLICNRESREATGPINQIAWLPGVILSGPDTLTPDTAGSCAARVTLPGSDAPYPRPLRLLLESNAGYLPLREVTFNGADAAFSIRTDGLKPGDAIRIKAGAKFWSNLGSKHITITE